MSRLIVVSNRVAPVKPEETTAGGLAVGLLAALQEHGGIWFGWSGKVVGSGRLRLNTTPAGPLSYMTMGLTPEDHDEYYNGYSNRTLWPLFHNRLDLVIFDRHLYGAYRRVNRLFARRLYPVLEPDDIIWIHDYHLIPLAEELRELGVQGPMGFFLHTPFPAREILVALPRHAELVRALLAHDLVGFQTADDLGNLCDYLEQEADGVVSASGEVEAFGRRLRTGVFPVGIDTDAFAALAASPEAERQALRLARSLGGNVMISGVDRLDYTKGLVERVRAFEILLETRPELRERVGLVQISAPSREEVPEYAEIREELELAAGRINGRFASFSWQPVRYLNKSFSRRFLAGFYRASGVGLVTPLRDGMNLVAKEYVAAQNPDDPGVLVLSRFAGAARELDAALLVNPYDLEAVAEALHKALEMSLKERKDRWRSMMRVLRRNDVARWRGGFVDGLTAAHRRHVGRPPVARAV
ncbi:MAG: alpha,alpha-trehalose-phosphate synthase (UDP-forming) [Alphaproteobacteria bacterium]